MASRSILASVFFAQSRRYGWVSTYTEGRVHRQFLMCFAAGPSFQSSTGLCGSALLTWGGFDRQRDASRPLTRHQATQAGQSADEFIAGSVGRRLVS